MDMQKLQNWLAVAQFKGSLRGRTYRKIASFLKNGVSLSDTLRALYRFASEDNRKPKTPGAIIIRAWLDRVNNGQSFGRAVTGWVPASDRIVIEAGETAGSLAGALEDALFITESAKKIRTAIIFGLAYPAFLIMFAVGLLVIFSWRIVPAFVEVLPREKWTGTAAVMASVSDFVSTGLVPAILMVAAVIAVTIWSLPRWVGRWRVTADRFVPWSLYRLNMGSGFLLSVAALVKAGVKIPEILRILMHGAPPWYYERLWEALKHVNNGLDIGESLHRTGMNFPDRETVQDLRAYAGFDNFDETLELLGHQWVDESVDRVKAQMSVLRNVAIVVLGAVFGAIAVSIFSIQQQAASSL